MMFYSDIWVHKSVNENYNLGGTLKFLSLLVLEINTFFFRKDKFGISLKVIICTF